MKIPENDKFVAVITNEFNDAIVFDPDQLRMAYTVRDPIINSLVKYIFQLYNLTKFKLYIKLYIKGYLITRQIEDSPRSTYLTIIQKNLLYESNSCYFKANNSAIEMLWRVFGHRRRPIVSVQRWRESYSWDSSRRLFENCSRWS